MKRYLSVLLVLVFALPAPAQEKPFDAKPPQIKKPYATGRIAPPKVVLDHTHKLSWQRHGHKLANLAVRAVPEAFDCADFGLVPPIKDQSDCGSCHIFSACGVATSALIKAGQIKMSADGFSEQWFLDCQRQLGGCDGGWEWEDAQVLLKGGPLEGEYGPYKARAGSCKQVSKLYKIIDMGMCSQSEGVAKTEDLKACLVQFGPISVAVAADNAFAGYQGGLFEGSGSRSINHAVIITGWKTVNGKLYWKLRNSWNTGWGEKGYMWIREGANQVGDSAFWVKAEGVVPPEPVPPIPPGPVPPFPDPTGGTIALSSDLHKGLYKIVPADAEVIHSKMTLPEIMDTLDRVRKAREAKVPCCLPPAIDPRIEARFEGIERTNAAIVSVLEKLQKTLEKK